MPSVPGGPPGSPPGGPPGGPLPLRWFEEEDEESLLELTTENVLIDSYELLM